MAGVANSGPGSRMTFPSTIGSSPQQAQSQLQQPLTPLPRPSPNNICTTAPMSTTQSPFSITNSGSTSQFISNNPQQQVRCDRSKLVEVCKKRLLVQMDTIRVNLVVWYVVFAAAATTTADQIAWSVIANIARIRCTAISVA